MPRQLPNAPHGHPRPESLPLTSPGCPENVLCRIRRDFSRLSVCLGQVPYVLLTRAPVAGRRWQATSPAAPRLACVKPVASVHPEPGSNSSLLLSLFFLCRLKIRKSLSDHSPTFPWRRFTAGRAKLSVPTRFLTCVVFIGIDRKLVSSCTTSSIVILSMFSCLWRFSAAPEKLCKVTPNF